MGTLTDLSSESLNHCFYYQQNLFAKKRVPGSQEQRKVLVMDLLKCSK